MATKKERTDKQTNREGNAEEVHADEADTQPSRVQDDGVHAYIYIYISREHPRGGKVEEGGVQGPSRA